jgi:hypothetical protein
MTIKININRPLAYLLIIAVILALGLLLSANLRTNAVQAGHSRPPAPVQVVNTPLPVVSANSGSTKKITAGNTWLEPGQVYTALNVTGSGTFYSLWYSTTSEVVWMRMTIDGEVVWHDHTGIFGYNWAFNKSESGIGGTTNYGGSTHLGPIYGVYFKPSSTGLPFQNSLKIEFGNDASNKQLIYSVRGFYSIK